MSVQLCGRFKWEKYSPGENITKAKDWRCVSNGRLLD
jgi:hypothetical protein